MTNRNLVQLRNAGRDDLPYIDELQLDPESNRMAVTIPRTRAVFDEHWTTILDAPKNITKVILFNEVMVGHISCFPIDSQDHVGYWIDRAFWGRGIASRALQLLLQEVTRRPLIAISATSNVASRRVLEKCGFVVERTQISPADDRYPECEVVVLVLH